MNGQIGSRWRRFQDWLDERAAIRSPIRSVLDEPIKGGARWAYVFGSGLAVLFGVQVVSGVFLAMYYVPSADHAHASVAYIQKAAPGGALLRGLHHYSAHAMIVLMAAHLTQTFCFAAYKAKRELVWNSGGLMLLLILGLAFTGYLLPWDQEAYFGTQVAASIAGEVPLIGSLQQRLLLGGTELSSVTLSRFFMLHAFLLPLGVGVLLLAHLYLFRKAKPAGHFHPNATHRPERFYPRQLFKDTVFALLIFIAILLTAHLYPAKLGPEADATSDFLARPPWYFLPLFQLLKYFPGQWSLLPTVILPGLLFGAIFLLPFVDKRRERNPFKRPVAVSVLALVLLGASTLIVLSKYEDRRYPEIRAKLQRQQLADAAFLKAPFQPQEIGHPLVVETTVAASTNSSHGVQVFAENCALCHGESGEGGIGPALMNLTAKPQRRREDLLRMLDDARAFGLQDPMPAAFPQISAEDKKALVEWLVTLRTK